jgi:hypothetical protein
MMCKLPLAGPTAVGVNRIVTAVLCNGAMANGPNPESTAKGGVRALSETVSVLYALKLRMFTTLFSGATPIPTRPNRIGDHTESVPPGVGVGDGVGVADGDEVAIGVGVDEADGAGVAEAVGVAEGVGVDEADGAGVAEAVGVAVGVTDGVTVADAVGVAEAVAIGVAVAVGVAVGDAVGEGVGVALACGWSYSSTRLSAESAT